MKKIIACILCGILIFGSLPGAFAEEQVLRVYNWQDYINEGKDDDGAVVDESVIEMWEKDYFERTGKKVRVQYDTFETNETMLNTLKTGKTTYDLCCPSDYIIQKMILATENGSDNSIALEKFDISKMENYKKYVSPYISNMFESKGWSEYAVGYMWGTVGFIYNPEKVKYEDITTWDFFWNTDYKNRMTCKDTSRDAYVIGALYVHADELREAVDKYNKGEIDAAQLQNIVNDVANATDDETIEKVGKSLKEMKKNIYGFEVDNGKSDIVSGKIDANLAWSGDAVYALALAEEEDGKKLEYVIPDEGSTVWFDGWVMPKGANTELAQDFVDFLCRPDIAAYNMDYIGYTSVVAGDEIYDLVSDNYGEDEGKYEYDLTYFFEGTLSDDRYTDDGKVIIKTNDLHRQLMAQYPSVEESARLGIMEDFGDRNELVLEMWSEVKSNDLSPIVYVAMIGLIIIVAVFALFFVFGKRKHGKRRRHR